MTAKIHSTITAGLAALLGLCTAAALVMLGYRAMYDGRIYPGVSVRGVELGGLTVEEAASVMADRLPDGAAQTIELRAGEQSWQLSRAEAGQVYHYANTAAAAYDVARSGLWYERLAAPWRVRFLGQSVELQADPVDGDRVRAALEDLAPQIYAPPTDAELRITSEGVHASPGEAGRALDVEASVIRVLEVLAGGAAEVELVLVDAAPRRPEPEPAYILAQSLLAEPFTLVVDDPLTDYRATFEVPAEQMAAWLKAVPADDQIVLEVNEPAVRTWLEDVGSQLGPERDLVISQTLTRTVAALSAGEHRAASVVRHPAGTHTVEPGDTLFDIAYRHGFPQWRLEEANPNVDPDQLLVAMELTIPSIDILFPEPLVPDKRIEISLPEQRLRAYQNDELMYDFTCSTGMTSTPTIPGQFQVLFKEPEAYAQRWSLEMPYFLAVYYEGPDFANGIHELPIRSDGQRLWASVLGWPASYGCIILNVGDAEALYDWAPVGTLVRIEGAAPGTPVHGQQAEGEQ